LVIFIVALVLRLIWVSRLSNDLPWADERDYAATARHLAAGEGFISTSFRATPVVPFYLSLVFRVVGENFAVARIGQCVLGALTCWLLYLIAGRLFGPWAALVSGLCLAIYPFHIYLAGVFYPECMVSFFLTVTVYLAIRCRESQTPLGLALVVGVVLGVTALARGTYLACIPCVGLAWLYGAQGDWRRRGLLCGALALGAMAAILPWTLRNHHVYGRWLPVSSGFGMMLWRANNELATGDPSDRHLDPRNAEWTARLETVPPSTRQAVEEKYAGVVARLRVREAEVGDEHLGTDDVLGAVAREYIVTQPLKLVQRAGRRLVGWLKAFTETKTKNEHTGRRSAIIAAVSFYPILILGLIGMGLGWPRRRELALLYLVIAAITLVHLLLTVTTRYRLPLDPFLMVFAGVVVEWWRQRRVV